MKLIENESDTLVNTASHTIKSEPNWAQNTIEKLALASIKEQRSARRWRIFFRLIYLTIFCAIAYAIWTATSNTPVSGDSKHTALVQIDGEISSESRVNAKDINESLEKAFNNSHSVGVILQINSPGGSPVQSGLINRKIAELRKRFPKKPIFAVIEDLGASGGYYIAVAANEIYVDQASLIGSIGVISANFGFSELIKKLGVERRVQTAGSEKNSRDPFQPIDPQAQIQFQNMLNIVHRQFIDAVKTGRGKKLKLDEPSLFTGRVWTGEESVTLGLADKIGSIEDVAKNVFKAERIVNYTEYGSLSYRVAKRIGTFFNQTFQIVMNQETMQNRITLR